MAATNITLLIEQGIPFNQKFRAKNEDNSNKNLIGYTGRMHFRSSIGSAVVVLEATTANSKLTIDTTNSIVEIKLSEADTKLFIYKTYVYDIELVDATNIPLRFIEGIANISPEVTRTV